MGVLAHSDAMALEQLVVAWDHWRTLERAVQREGWTQESSDAAGNPIRRANPRVAMMEAAHQRLVRMLREFGLTPAARTRIRLDADTPAPADELEAALGGVG
jgi:P27 family predicted phage terminase small subunit